ncbi:MAG: sodium/proton-translocating pyrophosphatase, partial [Ferruginibacter sp.]
NAKKSFEKGAEINGEMFYKKSEPHKASVTGDTVGDPFKDTSGPSMNILIKLMSIISLVIAPTLAGLHGNGYVAKYNNTGVERGPEIKKRNSDGSISTNFSGKTASEIDATNLVQQLAKDDLIDLEDYTLKVLDGKLYLYGQPATPAQNLRYQAYLAPFKDVDLNININKK